MAALLLDSSDKTLTVGLSLDGKLLDSITYEAWQRQSEYLIPEIDKMLKNHMISRTDLTEVAVSKGPGSYTGVRIALTVAKTVSFALGIPLYLVSSLEVLAQEGKPSVCLMNARGKRSYFGVYNAGEENVKDCIKTNEEVLAYLKAHPDFIPCGDIAYLGLSSEAPNIAYNLMRHIDEAHRCPEPLGARPIYLKDDYEEGRFQTVVRKMMPGDIDAVMAIAEESLAHPYTREQMLYEMNENPVSYLYCAVVDKEVVGYIDFYITFDSCSIAEIAVKESFRSKGIGNRLIGQLIKDCESKEEPVSWVTLEVRKSNERAQKFYKRHQFEAVTIKKAYYEDGEDAVYMVRSL